MRVIDHRVVFSGKYIKVANKYILANITQKLREKWQMDTVEFLLQVKSNKISIYLKSKEGNFGNVEFWDASLTDTL